MPYRIINNVDITGECSLCGAVVADVEVHNDFHNNLHELAKITRELAIKTRRLR